MASNYDGYLIKIKGKTSSQSDYVIPLSMIKANSYNATVYGQDLDSYRDANGTLHREALKNFAPKCEFETIPLLTDGKVQSFMNNIRSRYTNETEKKCNVEMWCMELNKYVTHDMYMPDITFTPYIATSRGIKYNSFRVAFISYGGTV